jgi:malonate transporter
VSSILLPIFLLIGIGFAASRMRVVGEDGVKAMSDLAFMLFLPALLFRSMARTDFSAFPVLAPAAYFGTGTVLFALGYLVLRRRGLDVRRATVFGLSGTYSNLVMLGVPLVRLAYGERGLAVLLSLVALHALILLVLATLVVEFCDRAARAASSEPASRSRWAATLAEVARTAILQPVILPILAGFAWAQTGWQLPAPIDATLLLIGGAAPTLCLILLGASLVQFDPRAELGAALRLTLMKSIVHPLAVYAAGRWIFGLDTLSLSVLTVAASLPIGANAYLLAQRYQAGFAPISAGVTLSTVATGLTIGPLLGFLGH